MFQPRPRLSVPNPVLADVDQDRTETYDGGGDEETFCGVEEGGLEGSGEVVET